MLPCLQEINLLVTLFPSNRNVVFSKTCLRSQPTPKKLFSCLSAWSKFYYAFILLFLNPMESFIFFRAPVLLKNKINYKDDLHLIKDTLVLIVLIKLHFIKQGSIDCHPFAPPLSFLKKFYVPQN